MSISFVPTACKKCSIGQTNFTVGFYSIFREKILQIRGREAAGEAFLAEHVGDGLRLVLLQFPDFFLDRAGRNQPVGVDGLRLADAMRTVDGLRLDGGIPP